MIELCPRLFQIDNVLSEEYCKKVISASPFLKKSNIENSQKYELDFIDKNSDKIFYKIIDVIEKYSLKQNPVIPYRFIKIMRYLPNEGILVRHRDTYSQDKEYEKQSYTILIYLNDVELGGETVFFYENEEIIVKPKTGRLLIIPGDIEHEARTPISNKKYVTFSRHN